MPFSQIHYSQLFIFSLLGTTSQLGPLIHLVEVGGCTMFGKRDHNLRQNPQRNEIPCIPTYKHSHACSFCRTSSPFPSPVPITLHQIFRNASVLNVFSFFLYLFSNQSDISRQQIGNGFVIELGTKDTAEKHIKMFRKS
jgi:hypothetical protein